jgi:hypothetical protein
MNIMSREWTEKKSDQTGGSKWNHSRPVVSIGIPKNSVMAYETEVKNGKLLLIVHGTAKSNVPRLSCIRLKRRQQRFTPNKPPSVYSAVDHRLTRLSLAQLLVGLDQRTRF